MDDAGDYIWMVGFGILAVIGLLAAVNTGGLADWVASRGRRAREPTRRLYTSRYVITSTREARRWGWFLFALCGAAVALRVAR